MIAGPPQLMMAFTGDGAADPLMVAKRDALYGSNSEERKAHRAKALDFSYQPSKAADHWQQGKGAHQLQLNKTDFKDGEPFTIQSCASWIVWRSCASPRRNTTTVHLCTR